MRKYLPEEGINQRIKQGFSAPDASWFKGESIEYVQDKILRPNAKIYNYMDRKEISRLINLHLNGKENKRLLIWSLLSLEEWLGIF